MTTIPLRHPVFLFTALGICAGALSSVLTWVIWEAILPESPFDLPDPTRLPHGYVPGLVFGAVIGVALVRLGLASVARATLFALGATASCFLAYLAYFVLPDSAPQTARLPAYPVAGLVASGFGSALIAATAAGLFPFPRRPGTIALVVGAGALLGAASDLLAPYVSGFGSGAVWKIGAVAFYAVWQGAIAGALATGIRRGPDGAVDR